MGFVVAVDGASGTGKGTVTRIVAEKLGLVTIDTGALYRCVTLEVLNKNISFDDTTLDNYYSAIAEAGLYLKTNGTLGITNYDVVNSDLYGVNLGVNISIYYIGGGVL